MKKLPKKSKSPMSKLPTAEQIVKRIFDNARENRNLRALLKIVYRIKKENLNHDSNSTRTGRK